MNNYAVHAEKILASDAYSDASREELRVLVALIAEGGVCDADSISERTGVSRARAASALMLWEEAGVIEKVDTPPAVAAREQTITEEFEERVEIGKLTEITAEDCARSIRDGNLSALLSECASLMGKAALSTEEAKIISSVYTQYALGEEFVLTLAAYILESRGRLTAVRLASEAERLIKRGVDTTEELERYIGEKENESGAEWEFKRLLGIHNRTLSAKERELVNRWYYEYAFGEDIIGEAYDLTVMNTGKLSLPYMDKLISHWHECGCRTAEDCRTLSARERAEKAATEKAKTPPRMPRTPRKENPTYGNFDVDEAFRKSLMRSYGDSEIVDKMISRDKDK